MSELILAVDGGGYKTEFVLADVSGVTVAELIVDSTNANRVGIDLAVERLLSGSSEVMYQAGFAPNARIGAAVFGLAGVDTPDDEYGMQRRLADVADHTYVMNDVMLPLGAHPGVALIAGTGSNCIGRSETGEAARAGGHGPDYDEGSGAWLARQALGIVSKMMDERLPIEETDIKDNPFASTVLRAAQDSVRQQIEAGVIKDYASAEDFVAADFSALYRPLYQLGPQVKQAMHSTIVPVLFDLAESGDETAAELVESGSQELATHVTAVSGRLAMAGFNLTVTGSLLTKRVSYREKLLEKLDGRVRNLTVMERPIDGAVQIARQLLKA